MDPFISLRNAEVNGNDHPLMRTSPRPQGSSRGHRTLSVDDTVTGFGESMAQRVAEEHFVPMPIPDDTSGPTAPHQREADTEHGYGELRRPRERCDERGSRTASLKVPP